jgi:ribonuclease P protein component
VTTAREQAENARGSRPDRRLRRAQRLVAVADFEDTYGQGKSWAGRYMVLWLRRGPGAALRLGVVASRTVGNAVARNRAKRRLREVWRINRHRLAGECDVVLVARRRLLTAPWEDVVDELAWLTRKAGLHGS